MKFRYKVLMCNILLLSVSMGISCFFMIYKNVNLALESQIKSAVDENNLLQSAVEYQLLGMTKEKPNKIRDSLSTICKDIYQNANVNQTDLFVIYGGNTVFSEQNSPGYFPDELWEKAEIGKKNYMLIKQDDNYSVFTTSCSVISGQNLNIISRHDITDIYKLMLTQIAYYRILLLMITFLCSLIMYLLSYLLTKPLESLRKVSDAFGKGDYSLRSNIRSSDEVGTLSNTYNQMAESVSEHMDELEEMIKRQDQFVSDFSHELKTPMTSIIGFADMIRRKELPRDTQVTAASYIFDEGKRLETMSQKLFDLIYTKQHRIHQTSYETQKLMEEINQSVTPSLAVKNLHLVIVCEPDFIFVDSDLMKSAFINMIDNSRKASSTGNQILFTGRSLSTSYQFMIQDFGIGMEPEHLSHIMDEFYMIDKSRSRKEGGAGLGLSLAALIIKRHNGSVSIESTPSIGTTITVTLPKEEKITHEN